MVILGALLLIIALIAGVGILTMSDNTGSSESLVFFGYSFDTSTAGVFLVGALFGALALTGLALIAGKVLGASRRKRAVEAERQRADKAEADIAALAQQNEQRLGHEVQQHQQQLVRQRQEAEAQRAALVEQHQQELARNKEEHQQALAQHKQEAEAERAALVEKHDQERQAVRDAMEQAKRALGGQSPESADDQQAGLSSGKATAATGAAAGAVGVTSWAGRDDAGRDDAGRDEHGTDQRGIDEHGLEERGIHERGTAGHSDGRHVQAGTEPNTVATGGVVDETAGARHSVQGPALHRADDSAQNRQEDARDDVPGATGTSTQEGHVNAFHPRRADGDSGQPGDPGTSDRNGDRLDGRDETAEHRDGEPKKKVWQRVVEAVEHRRHN